VRFNVDINDVTAAIKEIAQPFADRRIHLFAVELAAIEDSRLRLRGRVLDSSGLAALHDGLAARFPGWQIDLAEVEVLRKTPPRWMTVATNLSSLHDGTSFLAEQMTQLLNGAQLEVLFEEKNWCFVRQTDGYLGWTYKPYLTEIPAPQPTHLVTAPVGLLLTSPESSSGLVTRVLGGTSVHLREQRQDWVAVDLAGGTQGWLPVSGLRAVDAFPLGAVERRAQMVEDAFTMIGVPYLWGGCTAHGIDCSGFAQLLHRWIGITLPRDADMQFEAGRAVEPPFNIGDLLFFGETGEKRRITHVGVSLGGWRMIHSSRSRNGVQIDDVQMVDHLRQSYLCAATYIGR
jgi:cell wall-associated NlpC family hydrolase